MNEKVIGLFKYVDNLIGAADKIKNAGYKVTVFSSVPLVHELDDAFGEEKSSLKWFTLFGGASGFVTAILLVLVTTALYTLPRGGRPLFSFTPTLLLCYIFTILFGVCITYVGFVYLAGLPDFFKKRVDEPDVAVDAFGLLVNDADSGAFDNIEKIMKEHGAYEVKRVEEE